VYDSWEHLIAGVMAVRVVDLLHPVDVDERNGERLTAATRAFDLLLQIR
jgi:hypothetical protein